jgi:predicted alpha/beta hydrolase family esterase
VKAKKVNLILFIQGGGERGYEADEVLVISLKKSLGKRYQISYPEILSDESASDFGWTKQIGEEISKASDDFILVGHSLGASMILKYLSENSVSKKIEGIFLIATPFWSGNEEWKAGLKLKNNFADKLPVEVQIFMYHCKDDEEVPFSHFEQYKQKIPQANFREIKNGGHQLNNDLTLIAEDIKSL